MRTVFILVYVAAVLLISGFARAESASVSGVTYDASNFLVHIKGQFTSSCQSNPRPAITRSESERGLHVVNIEVDQDPAVLCAQNLTGSYDLVFDLRVLNLPENVELIVAFANAQPHVESLKVFISHNVNGLQFSSLTKKGLLVAMAPLGLSGDSFEYALVDRRTGTSEVVLIKSLIDLSKYAGSPVILSGTPIVEVGVPEFGVDELDFEQRKSKTQRLIFVSGISTVPLQ